jgi:prolipoprotein diacylglyceryltransferase
VGQFGHVLPQAVYPTPLWEAIAGILVFVFLFSIRNRVSVAGTVSGLYLILMGVERFLVEKIRVNTTYHLGDWQITQAEIISSVSVLAGVFILVLIWRKREQFAYKNHNLYYNVTIEK